MNYYVHHLKNKIDVLYTNFVIKTVPPRRKSNSTTIDQQEFTTCKEQRIKMHTRDLKSMMCKVSTLSFYQLENFTKNNAKNATILKKALLSNPQSCASFRYCQRNYRLTRYYDFVFFFALLVLEIY